MARGRKRYLPLFGSVGRLRWFLCRPERRRAPAAAAAAVPQPHRLPLPPPPAPPSPPPSSLLVAAAVVQHQPVPQPQPQPLPPSPSTSFAPPAPSVTSSDASSTSLPVVAPRETHKRKAEESFSDDDADKVKKGKNTLLVKPLRKKVTLEEIRELPPSGTRPFYPRKMVPRYRSIAEPLPWECSVCQYENVPQTYLLFALPAFKCRSCGAAPCELEGDTDFGFCYADLGINHVCPIGHVKQQGYGECIANSIASCIEITDRIMMTILDEPVSKKGPYIDIADLINKYRKRWHLEVGADPPDRFIGYSVWTMLDVLKFEGVKEMSSGGIESDKLHKISDWASLDSSDFVGLCAALADGYPLPFGFDLGKNIPYLETGEIYVPPPYDAKDEDGEPPDGHYSVLVGAQQIKDLKFFYFLNCWGEDFCRRTQDECDSIRGGVGAIISNGIRLPYQIFRFNEKKEQKVQDHWRF